MVSPTVQQIAQQNDQFRRGDPNVPGIRVITAGLDHLFKQLDIPPEDLAQAVTEYAEFTEANDPHGERDFGVFEFHQHKLFWKIDAYNQDVRRSVADVCLEQPSQEPGTRRFPVDKEKTSTTCATCKKPFFAPLSSLDSRKHEDDTNCFVCRSRLRPGCSALRHA